MLTGEQDENGASVISKLDQPTTLQTAIDATFHIPNFFFTSKIASVPIFKRRSVEKSRQQDGTMSRKVLSTIVR
jgi:hypothetical protein